MTTILPSGPQPSVEELERLKAKGELPSSWDVPFTRWQSYEKPTNLPPDDTKRLFDKEGHYRGGA